jgi:hypothetical protein
MLVEIIQPLERLNKYIVVVVLTINCLENIRRTCYNLGD